MIRTTRAYAAAAILLGSIGPAEAGAAVDASAVESNLPVTDAARTGPATEPARVPHGRVGIEPISPAAWVERIVAMRAAGNDAAADQDVAALARRYPDFRIPERARAGSGR